MAALVTVLYHVAAFDRRHQHRARPTDSMNGGRLTAREAIEGGAVRSNKGSLPQQQGG